MPFENKNDLALFLSRYSWVNYDLVLTAKSVEKGSPFAAPNFTHFLN